MESRRKKEKLKKIIRHDQEWYKNCWYVYKWYERSILFEGWSLE